MGASIPGRLRAYLHTNEIITSLMLNYVAALVMYYLIFDSNSLLAGPHSATWPRVPAGEELPTPPVAGDCNYGCVPIPLGLLFGVGRPALIGLLHARTRFGYEDPRDRRFPGGRHGTPASGPGGRSWR